MAAGIYAIIATGLYSHLEQLALSPAMPISFPNDNFTPVTAGYLRANDFPASADQVTLGDAGQNRYIGTLQVSVFWPLGKGTAEPRERADLIAAHYKRGTIIEQDGLIIRVVKPPQIAAPIIDKRSAQVPVSIRYQVDASNPA